MERVEGTMKTPELETERLVLRPFSRDDLGFVLRHFSDPDTNRYSSFEDLKDMKEAEELYEKFLKPGHTDKFRLLMALKGTEEPIGTIGLHAYSRRDRTAELGFDMVRSYWGKGLMTEAVLAIIGYGFEDLGLNRLEAGANARNERSIRLMERLGFKREGLFRQKFFYKEGFQDDVRYSIIKDEWERIK